MRVASDECDFRLGPVPASDYGPVRVSRSSTRNSSNAKLSLDGREVYIIYLTNPLHENSSQLSHPERSVMVD